MVENSEKLMKLAETAETSSIFVQAEQSVLELKMNLNLMSQKMGKLGEQNNEFKERLGATKTNIELARNKFSDSVEKVKKKSLHSSV
jgi:small-conductance mechanosensitive channel